MNKEKLKIKGFFHFAINTLDINESVEFYKEVLRLPVGKVKELEDFGIVELQVTEDTFFELFDMRGQCTEFVKVAPEKDKFRHIALSVENIHDWYEHLKECGVTFELELTYLEEHGHYAILFYDPNGVIIELNAPK